MLRTIIVGIIIKHNAWPMEISAIYDFEGNRWSASTAKAEQQEDEDG